MKRFFTRKKIIIFAVLILLVGFRLYLPTLAKNFAEAQLNRDPLYRGQIEEVKLHLWRGAYSAIGLKIERVRGQKQYPFISAREIQVGLNWKELFHKAILAKVEIDDGAINIVAEPKNPRAPATEKSDGKPDKKIVIGANTKEKQKEEVHSWRDVLKKLIPLDISKLTVRDSSFHYRDITSSPKVNVYLDHVSIDGNNFTNSHKLSKDLFGTATLKARAMKSGDLDVLLLINPLVSPPEFKTTVKLQSLDLRDLNDFFTAYGSFDVKKGKFNLYSEVATAEDQIKGYVKPIIKDLEVADFKKDVKKGLGHAFWEQIVGAAGGILKNHHEGQQAARIPFSGKLSKPDVDGWAVASSILTNIFVKPISPDVEHSVKLADVKKNKKK